MKTTLAVFLLVSTFAFAQTPPGTNAVCLDDGYKAKAAKWVAALNLTDSAKVPPVTKIITTHLISINAWHNEHPHTTVPAGRNPVSGKPLSPLDRQFIADSAIPPLAHETLMTGLRRYLTSDQVEAILDQYTIGKVAFTMKAYRAIVPDLTEAEAATILGNLKQAREEAIDYATIREISLVFEIYKTKSEQYINTTGRNWKQLYQSYTDKIRAEKSTATKP